MTLNIGKQFPFIKGDTFMKKLISILLCVLFLFSFAGLTVSASEARLVSEEIQYLDNGDYIVTRIYEDAISPLANVKSGQKKQDYYVGNKHIFSVTVNGSFSYTGSTATATSAASTVAIYNADATYVSKNAYTAGPNAVASGTVKYSGSNRTLTVQLTCSGNGTLS